MYAAKAEYPVSYKKKSSFVYHFQAIKKIEELSGKIESRAK